MIEVDVKDLKRAEAMDIHKWLTARSYDLVDVMKVNLSAGGIIENGRVLTTQYNGGVISETWQFIGLLAAWMPAFNDPTIAGLRFRFKSTDEALLFKLTFGGS